MMQKVSPKIWIPVIIFILLAVGLAIFLSWPEVIPEKEISEVPVAWKTYRNEGYGFEIKYPLRYQPKEKSNFLGEFFLPSDPSNFFRISTLTLSEGQSLQTAADALYHLTPFIYKTSWEKIAGYDAVVIKLTEITTEGNEESVGFSAIINRPTQGLLLIEFSSKIDFQKINKILSSFKFIK